MTTGVHNVQPRPTFSSSLSRRTRFVFIGVCISISVACAPGPTGDHHDYTTHSEHLSPQDVTDVRIVTANLSTGNNQSYDNGEGIRILQGLHPDIILIQEFNYGDNSDQSIQSMIQSIGGSDFSLFREPEAQIPNGILSRWPIVDSGTWVDNFVSNRGFAWAQIQLPGGQNLWAICVHLLTRDADERAQEARELVDLVQKTVSTTDFLVVGGDFNTASRDEQALNLLTEVVDMGLPDPNNGAGDVTTNPEHSRQHDFIFVSPNLKSDQIPVTIGSNSFPSGLVFDSRNYQPLADVAPILVGDSASPGMQHLAVAKDFAIPAEQSGQ